ncbi:hypothetical protein OSB04_012526 [Centaurea solstitialis]|uniref:Calmodulin-binding protein n=1 Tax=Centaurea solstitialis TaxID=347529 RepID=A0AA38WEN7_9ASTR|nr:hypothetical protein OSB04_012526 [Centaurea solstitialis]
MGSRVNPPTRWVNPRNLASWRVDGLEGQKTSTQPQPAKSSCRVVSGWRVVSETATPTFERNMDGSRGGNKRGYEDEEEVDDDNGMPQSKKPKIPGLARNIGNALFFWVDVSFAYIPPVDPTGGGSTVWLEVGRAPTTIVIVEALKVDSLQRLCSSLEPLFRKIVSEEVERALTRFGHGQIAGRSSPPRIQGSEGKVLQLQFRTRMPPHLFTGGKVEGEQGAAIHVVLLDSATGNVVQTGPESSAKLNVVVLEGDFNEELDENWSADHFESHEVKAREGKRPLLTGELQVTLNEGVGTLGDLSFTDNSSWIRSRKFRLGLKVTSGYCVGIRIREAKTESFAVKDHRGECMKTTYLTFSLEPDPTGLTTMYVTYAVYKKHYPPVLHDEVWRLDRIAKDGALHKKLMKAQVITVEDFLRVLVKDPQKLRNILGSGMSNRMWENTVEHAKTCVLGGKLYVYYADLAHTTGAIFNHIYELRGLIADGQFVALESLSHDQKISVDSLVKRAYENWNRVVEYDGKVLAAITVPAPPAQNLIEYPFISSDPTVVGVSSNAHHQSALASYRPAGPSTFDVSGDWSSPGPHGFGDSFSEEVRMRSSEMLETDDMQKLLRSFGVGETGPTFGLYENGSYGYNVTVPHEPQVGPVYGHGPGRGSGKAVIENQPNKEHNNSTLDKNTSKFVKRNHCTPSPRFNYFNSGKKKGANQEHATRMTRKTSSSMHNNHKHRKTGRSKNRVCSRTHNTKTWLQVDKKDDTEEARHNKYPAK